VILATSTLKRLSVQLDGSFLQTHKSFLINKNKVVAVSNDYIELISGTIVKVGKSYKEVSRSLL
jgi:DNA-binding LytR/AlgR family response regulator